MAQTFSKFADTIREKNYSHSLDHKTKETWEQTAARVAHAVFGPVKAAPWFREEAERAIANREFMPGGRYLYASGRDFHQVQNCNLFRAEDSREGWSELAQKSLQSLMTGAGIGVVYSDIRPEGKRIRRTGGKATGPLALMNIINEAGRYVMQGGARRSAIWAGLHWWHEDVFKFLRSKDWSEDVKVLKTKDFAFPATLDGTNISVILDRQFFDAFHDEAHPKHATAQQVYWEVVRHMCETGEPGFSIDYDDARECLRNAPVAAGTHVLTSSGYQKVGNIVDQQVTIWTGQRWANTTFKKTASGVQTLRVKMTGSREIVCDPSHEFVEADGSRTRADQLYAGIELEVSPPRLGSDVGAEAATCDQQYTLGFLFGDGSFREGHVAEVTLCTPEKRACRARFCESMISLEDPNDARGYHRIYLKDDNISNYPKTRLPIIFWSWTSDEQLAFLAGLFDADGSYDAARGMVRLGSVHETFLHDVRRALEMFNIYGGVSKAGLSGYSGSQGYLLAVQSSFVTRFSKLVPTCRLAVQPYEAYRKGKIKVVKVEPGPIEDVFCCDVGVHEHSFMAEGVIISNCTEITSADDSDICNLGSINMARVESPEHMLHLVRVGTAFLLAGTVYSHVPFPKVDQVRTRNRRLGLGLMGIHEWLVMRGKRYGPDAELEEYLKLYATSTDVAHEYAEMWELTPPIKTRAIAPTGTISIVAETTSGIEPLFCKAYKRRYLKGKDVFEYQYVVDPAARRMLQAGIDARLIEDAYDLAADVERRVSFQAWTQRYVDHAISSTINLPAWGSEWNNERTTRTFGEMLIGYLPQLRGITCYPDGARDGQPLTACSLEEALAAEGKIFLEQGDVCKVGKGGSCGD